MYCFTYDINCPLVKSLFNTTISKIKIIILIIIYIIIIQINLIKFLNILILNYL